MCDDAKCDKKKTIMKHHAIMKKIHFRTFKIEDMISGNTTCFDQFTLY